MFVLNLLINNRIQQKGGKLYVAFVDFKAASDKVSRKLMLRKIWEQEIKGNMHRMIRGIYRETNKEVISEEGISEGFEAENGVRQRSPIRPTLFNLFLDDIDQEWEKSDARGTIMARLKFYVLNYADYSRHGGKLRGGGGKLTRVLKIMEKFVRKVHKTKIMMFQNSARRKKEKWELSGREVEVVHQSKYLVYWFSTGNRYGKHLRNVTEKAQKRWTQCGAFWNGQRRKSGTMYGHCLNHFCDN